MNDAIRHSQVNDATRHYSRVNDVIHRLYTALT